MINRLFIVLYVVAAIWAALMVWIGAVENEMGFSLILAVPPIALVFAFHFIIGIRR